MLHLSFFVSFLLHEIQQTYQKESMNILVSLLLHNEIVTFMGYFFSVASCEYDFGSQWSNFLDSTIENRTNGRYHPSSCNEAYESLTYFTINFLTNQPRGVLSDHNSTYNA